jgi:hypothetical protein
MFKTTQMTQKRHSTGEVQITRMASRSRGVPVESHHMNSTFALSPKGWFAVALVACVLAAFALATGELLLAVVAFCTAGIAAFDSMHIHSR